ncbi:hypothetical protein EsHS_00000080 [Epichloe bromicola]
MKKSGVLSCFLAVSQIAGAVVVEIRHNQIRAGPKFEYDPATTKYCSFWYDNVDGRTSCKDIPDSWDITEEQWKRWHNVECSAVVNHDFQYDFQQQHNSLYDNTEGQVQSGDTCDKIAKSHGITVSEFTTWNADIGGQACTGLWRDTYVCVSVIGHEPKPTPSKPDNGIATPSPFQPVKEFTTWNPDIGGEACTELWLDTYVCVSVIGYKPTPLTQPGIEKSCNKLHKAVAGDTCQKIVDRYGDLALAEFYKWNSAVGNGK